MGFLAFAAAGASFITIGAFEALSKPKTPPSHSFLFSLLTSLVSSLFLLSSITSFFLASHDPIAAAQHLQIAAISALFLLHSLASLLLTNPPQSLLNLIALFAFAEQFVYFYLQRKDTVGIENRYFDMLLVPITVCLISTILLLLGRDEECGNLASLYPKIGRGIGLAMQGMWFVQMGVSIFTRWLASGCEVKERSWGNYTVRCKGHSEYHRARAIATLQFNCHLALAVVLVVGVYSVVARRRGIGAGDFSTYKLLGETMQERVDSGERFTLDSDEDEEVVGEEGNVVRSKEVELGVNVNGNGAHT